MQPLTEPRPVRERGRYNSPMKSLALLLLVLPIAAGPVPEWRDLFNGKDLTGWVNVNTDKTTWSVENGMLVCSGHPTGVMRTDRQYENVLLHVEWMHTEPGGNSGMFLWTGPKPANNSPFPPGVEVQMLELDWPKLNPTADGKPRPLAYVHGELFGV